MAGMTPGAHEFAVKTIFPRLADPADRDILAALPA